MRATKHRSRPSNEWVTSTELLAANPLYLMAKIGPSVFQLRDENEGMLKVTLGNPHSCSCGIVDCIHIAYCILKVLKVPASHMLSYQAAWTDNEMDQVLSGACSPPIRRQINHPAAIVVPAAAAAAEEVKQSSAGFVSRKEIDEDSCCPICQEGMTMNKGPSLTWCRRGCGNNLHASCMSIYVDHQQQSASAGHGNHHGRSSSPSPSCPCPFCRSDWDLPLLKLDLLGDKQSNKASKGMVPIKCSFCRGGVISKLSGQGIFYRCIPCSLRPSTASNSSHSTATAPSSLRLCKPVDLCQDCFPRCCQQGLGYGYGLGYGHQHQDHPFLQGEGAFDHWLLGPHCPPNRPLSTILAESLPMPGPGEAIGGAGAGLCMSCHSPATTTTNTSATATVILPCRHLIHRHCLETELSLLIGDIQQDYGNDSDNDDSNNPLKGIIKLAKRFRCTAIGCGQRVFPVLLRRPDRLATTNHSTSNNGNTNGSVAAAAAGGGRLLWGLSLNHNRQGQDCSNSSLMVMTMAATGQSLLLPPSNLTNSNSSNQRRAISSASAPPAGNDHSIIAGDMSSLSVSSRQTTVGIATSNSNRRSSRTSSDGARTLPFSGGGEPPAAATANSNTNNSLQLGSLSSSLLLSEANNSGRQQPPQRQQQQRSKIGALSSLSNRPPRPSVVDATIVSASEDDHRMSEIASLSLGQAAAIGATSINNSHIHSINSMSGQQQMQPRIVQRRHPGNSQELQRQREEACRDLAVQAMPLQQLQLQQLGNNNSSTNSSSSSSKSGRPGRLARLGMLRVSSASSAASLLALPEPVVEPQYRLVQQTAIEAEKDRNRAAATAVHFPSRPRTRTESIDQQTAPDLMLLTIRHYDNS